MLGLVNPLYAHLDFTYSSGYGYAGQGVMVEAEGERPMRVRWRLVDGLAAEVWMGMGLRWISTVTASDPTENDIEIIV